MEATYRFSVFQANLQKIRANPTKLGITELADMTEIEFKTLLLTLKPSNNTNKQSRDGFFDFFNLIIKFIFSFLPSAKCVPTNDCKMAPKFEENKNFQKDFKYISPIINQGKCGSCYACAYTTALVDTWRMQSESELPGMLSVQEIVDCSKSQGNQGCDGGLMHYAHQFVKDNNGMNLVNDYRAYEAKEGECEKNSDKNVLKNIGPYIDVPCDENEFKRNIDAKIAMAIAVDATKWQLYSGGILQGDDDCCGPNLNHAVTLIGYGNENGVDYWLIKNSWGTNWGEAGLVRIEAHRNCLGMMFLGGYVPFSNSTE